MPTFARTLLFSSLLAPILPNVAVADGTMFLGSRAQHASAAGLRGAMEFSDLLHEIEKLAGRDHRLAIENRVGRLEEALQPGFAAMPKDVAGRLDPTGVRYLLHRLFVQRHGWFVTGLDNGGDAWNSSSPAAVFKEHAAEQHGLFEDKLSNQSFTLHQVAVFAATLETLVHGESRDRLQAVYRVLGFLQSESLSESEAVEAIRAYMVMYVSATNVSSVTRREFLSMASEINETYPTFPDTEAFVRQVRQRILDDTPDSERNTWDTMLKVVEEVGERYGRWQDKECHDLKRQLLKMENLGTGRVRIQDFYADALNGGWQFGESVPYLRQLGALDDSDAQQMSVIIPNYLTSPTNCVASSKYYSVCCIDECDALLGHLENRLAAPDATPRQIADLVAALPSDTVQAPRSLPGSLVQRLEEVATHHGGRVPLHGRLFAQWMHHAYPRECPYPHIFGTTNPITADEWMAQSDVPVMAEKEDIEHVIKESRLADPTVKVQAEQALPWSTEEELFLLRPSLPDVDGHHRSMAGRFFMLVAALFSAVMIFMRSYTPGKSLPVDKSNHKYYV